MARSPRLLNFAERDTVALAHNAEHQFAAQHALCLYPSNSVYTLIPKNACSTLRFSLAVANGCLTPDSDFRWIHRNNLTFRANLRELVMADHSFVVLRCPLDRLASCFMDKFVGGYALAWQMTPQWENEDLPQDLSFRQFVDLLEDPARLRANHHWRPQTDFLVYRDYDRYYDFADMAAATRDLQDWIGLELLDTRDKTGHGASAFEKVEGDYADATCLDLAHMKREGRLPHYRGLFDNDILEKTSALYADDLALYAEKTGKGPSISATPDDQAPIS